VGQVGAQQPIQLLFQLGSGRCFEVQALTADGAREHLHVLLRAGSEPDRAALRSGWRAGHWHQRRTGAGANGAA